MQLQLGIAVVEIHYEKWQILDLIFFQVPCESHYHYFFICRAQSLSLLWNMSAIFYQTHAILLGDTLQQVFTSSIWYFTHLLELSYLKHIEFAQPAEVVKLDGWLSFKYVYPHGLTSVHLILSRNSFPEKAPEYHITCHYHCCAARTLQEMFVDSHWQITFILICQSVKNQDFLFWIGQVSIFYKH